MVSGLAVAGQAGQMDVSVIDTDKRRSRRHDVETGPEIPKVSSLKAV